MAVLAHQTQVREQRVVGRSELGAGGFDLALRRQAA